MTFGNMALVERVYDDGARASRQINLVTGKTVAKSFNDGRGYHFNKNFVDGSKEYINVKNIPKLLRWKCYITLQLCENVFLGWGEECVALAKHDFPHPKRRLAESCRVHNFKLAVSI